MIYFAHSSDVMRGKGRARWGDTYLPAGEGLFIKLFTLWWKRDARAERRQIPARWAQKATKDISFWAMKYLVLVFFGIDR